LATLCLALLAGCGAAQSSEEVEPMSGGGKGDSIDCPPASPLYKSVRTAALAAQAQGTLPAGQAVSLRNRAASAIRIDAPAIFARLAALVESAEHEVDLQTYSFDPSADPARSFLAAIGALERRRRNEQARSPVVVRLLLNISDAGLNDAPPTEELLRDLVGKLQMMKLDPGLVRYEISTHTHVSTQSLHSKVVIVDGRTAFVTSANMNDSSGFQWGEHNAAFELEGEVARSLLAEFDDAWSRSRSWNVTYCGPLPWPLEPLPAGECLRENDGPPSHALPAPSAPAACAPMLVVGRRWRSGLSDDDHFNPQDQAILAALDGGQRLIRIRTPNLNVAQVKTAIVHTLLARPELVVQLVLAKGYEDLAEQFDGGTNDETVDELYSRLSAVGMPRICERLQVRWYSRKVDGVTPVEGNLDQDEGVNGPSHVKYLSVDGQLAIVGSANLDNQSFSRSREVNVVIDSADVVAAWDTQLFGAELKGAVPVDACR
jgi:phosphatidylserine/phosphatidylglycerophosphate/cardiolipin synthase-like enzyme